MRIVTASLLLLLALAPAANAQLDKLVESIEVRVTNIDVVVTDKDGNPVTGLTKDDFRVYEDGKLQPLTNFYEVREAVATRRNTADASVAATNDAATAVMHDPRQRRVIFFIDNYSMHPSKRAEVLRSIQKFFDQLLVPGDEAAIVTWNRGLKIVRSFTGDLDLLRASLHELETAPSGGLALDNEFDRMKSNCSASLADAKNSSSSRSRGISIGQAHDQCLSMAFNTSEDLFQSEHMLSDSIGVMLSTLAGIDGKKVMVFAGAHLPDHPGLELFQWVDDLFAPYLPNSTPSTMNARATRTLTSSLDAVARRANANGVTMYMIDAADNIKNFSPSADTNSPGGVDPTSSFISYSSTLTAFAAVAGSTGGMALTRANSFDSALRTLARDLNAYYSLGYRADEKREGERKMTVTCTRPGVTVRARRTYVSRSPEEQMNERVVANIFHRSLVSQLAVTLVADDPKREAGGAYRVPIRVSIPASAITLIPNGNEIMGGFDVFIAVGDDTGRTSPITKRGQVIRVPAAAADAVKKQPLVFNAEVLVQRGEHVLSVAVVDRLTNAAGFARAKLLAK